MKKIFALVLMVVLVLSMSVTAFALNSPEADPVHKVYVINGNGAKVEIVTVKDGESVTFKADADKGSFDDWKIYQMDGKTSAVAGQDYTLGNGESLTGSTITLSPEADLIVTGNYDGKVTEFEIGQNGEPNSPQTGDSTVVCLAAVMLLALTGMVVLKKHAA